ncbi:MAG: type I DNA topoisomerase [Candidatus Omnitrophota bacterium]
MSAKKNSGHILVIVESPAKAKKIKTFLGKEYKVMASVGHVRDLPSRAAEIPKELKKNSWATLGVNVENDFQPLYLIPASKKKVIKEIRDAMKDAGELLVATDEDREGESIGWHLVEVLDPEIPVRRMVFSEITEEAIEEAIRAPREIDTNLVSAQETRRVLDRLYGYTLSPLLWKKIATGLSAGRVQSVAVKILVEREMERRAFRSACYWDLKAELATAQDETFTAELATVRGKKVASGKDFDESTGRLKEGTEAVLLVEEEARRLLEEARRDGWAVSSVEEKRQLRRPYPPFITSTLQQEANRKLSYSAKRTMQVAQRLYENGHITYMRTDSVHLSDEVLNAARRRIENDYGREYLSPEVRQFTSKSKSAQEAHEAIRPAGKFMKTVEELGLSGEDAALYSLIWKRTMATQMADARLNFLNVTIRAGELEFRATGKAIEFPGFFRAYVEGADDPEAALEDREDRLPALTQGQKLNCRKLEPVPHETKPPARYTEATLVRKLEEEDIGRPSTYASILATVQERGYVRKEGNQLIPTFVAVAVHQLLEKHFSRLVDLGFTAEMERKLDAIAEGHCDRSQYLREFYSGADGLAEQVRGKEEKIDAREACTLKLDGIPFDIRIGRFGPYLEKTEKGSRVTVSLPDETAPADLRQEFVEELFKNKKDGPKVLGEHPESHLPVYLMRGPYGPYVQLGDFEGEKKPRRVGVPRERDPETVDLKTALALLALPRKLGAHPETTKPVTASIGRFGPYVSHEGKYKSLPKGVDVLSIGLEEALELLAQVKAKAEAKPLREIGPHPKDGKPVAVFEGIYGPYVKHGKVNATLPKDQSHEHVTLEEAVALIEKRRERKKAHRRK